MSKLVDMHIHSYYSDGTMSPKEILDTAISKNVRVIAITDHDVLEGSIELLELSKDYEDIKCISGVEIDALEQGIYFHILGYNIDLVNEEFQNFIIENRNHLEKVNIKLIGKMEKDYEDISVKDYMNFTYDRKLGGWKALHYFMEKGLTHSLLDGFSIYRKYEHTYSCVAFPDMGTVCQLIHNAGGKAILAHPGRVLKGSDVDVFSHEVKRFLPFGLDGIECYYPTHSKEITDACLAICKDNKLLITCGSDCHGEFEDTQIGENQVALEQLNLAGIL